MEVKHYDPWESDKIYNKAKLNPIEGDLLYKEYLKRYPTDYLANVFYISNLITINRAEEAQEELKILIKKYKEDENFLNISDRRKLFEKELLFTKLRLLCYQGKYKEFLNLYKKNETQLKKDRNLNHIVFYIKKQQGLLTDDRSMEGYILRQIVEYRESEFLEHIENHLADYNYDIESQDRVIFVSDFPIREIVEEVKKNISFDMKLSPGFFDEAYVFKYDNCGRVNNKLANYFKVICFKGTKDIITMYPALDCEHLPCIDLNYIIENKKENTRKRPSALDKFNQRYKRK